MKLLKNKDYKDLIDGKKQAEKEIGRKENCIQKKQHKINNIDKLIKKLKPNANKKELNETIDKIKTTIEN
jgi:peptidoglycan hydrolase CwlO-like protein